MRKLAAWCTVVGSLSLLLSLGGCNKEPEHWQTAEAAGSIESYGEYLRQHPDGPNAADARSRVASLTDDRDWSAASQANTSDAYRKYLTDQPTGTRRGEAEAAIDAAAWKAASESRDLDAVNAYLAEHPAGAHAGPAKDLRFELVLTSHTWLRRNIKPGDRNTPTFRFNRDGSITVVSDSSGWNRWKIADGVLSINGEGAFRLEQRDGGWMIAGNQGDYVHEMTPVR